MVKTIGFTSLVKQFSTALFLYLAPLVMFAQSDINAGGGESNGDGGSVSYTLGQAAYQANSGIGGTVSEGVQHSYNISPVTGLEYEEITLVQVSVYPNPVTDYLQINIATDKMDSFIRAQYQLYDIQGNLLKKEGINSINTQIDMSGYLPSTYFVRVLSENQPIKEFKVIKY